MTRALAFSLAAALAACRGGGVHGDTAGEHPLKGAWTRSASPSGRIFFHPLSLSLSRSGVLDDSDLQIFFPAVPQRWSLDPDTENAIVVQTVAGGTPLEVDFELDADRVRLAWGNDAGNVQVELTRAPYLVADDPDGG
jgi:hypothetical protein